ncbi:hypothetical protein MTO96_045841 [Rhipicephalus appendiculatus]
MVLLLWCPTSLLQPTTAPLLPAISSHSKAITPDRTFPEGAPFAMNSCGIKPATSAVGKQVAPHADNKPLTTVVHQRQPDTVVPSKRDTGYQHDQVPQEKLNADNTHVNNSRKGNPE